MELKELKQNMSKARVLCYEITGSRMLAWIKYLVTYILFYFPEKFFMSLFVPITWLFLRESTLGWFFKLNNILISLYEWMLRPSAMLLKRYCNNGVPYERTVDKLWRCPYVPYNVIIRYMEHFGRECPDPTKGGGAQ